jgi:molybdopterin/thiamine biosynthesis adenylyltransferase
MENSIRAVTRQRSRPDGSAYSAIFLADALRLAEEAETSLADIERTALAMGVLPERYSRNQTTLSCADQLRLLNSNVVVVGLGGLGGTVTEILARLGIGQLTLVDGDVFDESNLNRQLLSSYKHLGQSKAMVAARRVNEINPAVAVRAVPDFLTRSNGREILGEAMVAVDCLDSIPDRFLLEEICKKTGIPMVSGAVAGTSGQAAVIYPDCPGLERIYGRNDQRQRRGIEKIVGTLPYSAMLIATIECVEVTALLLGRTASLADKLLFAELDGYEMTIVNF